MTSLSKGQMFLYEDLWQKKMSLAKVLQDRLGVESNLIETNILYSIIEYLEKIYKDKMNFYNVYRESIPSNNDTTEENNYYVSYIKGLKITGLGNSNSSLPEMITFDYSKPIDFFKKEESKTVLVKPPEILMVNLPGYNINLFMLQKGNIVKETNRNRIRNIRRYGVEILYIVGSNWKTFANIPPVMNRYHTEKINFYPNIKQFTENYRKVNIDPFRFETFRLNKYVKDTKYHMNMLLKNSQLIYNDEWVNMIFMLIENLYTKDENYNFDSPYERIIEIFILYKKIITLFPQGPNKQVGISDTFEIIKNIEIDKFLTKYFKSELGIDKNVFIKNNYHLIESKINKKNSLFRKEIKDWYRLQFGFYNLDYTKLLPF